MYFEFSFMYGSLGQGFSNLFDAQEPQMMIPLWGTPLLKYVLYNIIRQHFLAKY